MYPQLPQIKREGRVEIEVPCGERVVRFAYPFIGPGNYQNVGKKIIDLNLSTPNGDNTASLLYAAYCIPKSDEEPEFQNIREIMRNRWLWVFNQNLWTPRGVYVIQDANAEGRKKKFSVKELEKRLEGGKELSWGGIRFSKDGRERFAPKGSYGLGEHTAESLAKDGVMIASCGVGGAEKHAEVSTKFKSKACIHGVDVQEGGRNVLRVSSMVIYTEGLVFLGSDFDDRDLNYNEGGVAFGATCA